MTKRKIMSIILTLSMLMTLIVPVNADSVTSAGLVEISGPSLAVVYQGSSVSKLRNVNLTYPYADSGGNMPFGIDVTVQKSENGNWIDYTNSTFEETGTFRLKMNIYTNSGCEPMYRLSSSVDVKYNNISCTIGGRQTYSLNAYTESFSVTEPAQYDLSIAGTKVTDLNASDILGDGVFEYSSRFKRLTVNGDCTASHTIIWTRIPELTINVAADSTLCNTGSGACLELANSTTIRGSGKLTVTGNKYSAIILMNNPTLTINNADITAIGKTDGLNCPENMNLSSGGKLIVNNSNVSIRNGADTNAVFGFRQGIELTDCFIETPENYIISNGTIYGSNLSVNPNEVVIKRDIVNIGDYVQMGTYYGKSILWRCVDKDENGPLMLADKIICIKPFDAKGTNTEGSHGRGYYDNGVQGYHRQSCGSNYWGDSNIHDWLNSNEQSVTWSCGNPPDNKNVLSGYNAYANEAGFLTNFTSKERAAMKSVTQKQLLDGYEYADSQNIKNPNYHISRSNIESVVQNYDTAYSELGNAEKMFLLDVKQLYNVYQNDGLLGGENYYIGYPTDEAVNNSEFKKDTLNASQVWNYWLRTPGAGSKSYTVRSMESDGTVSTRFCYHGVSGIRPAFYLNMKGTHFTAGLGTNGRPYIIEVEIAPTPTPVIADIEIGDYISMGKNYSIPMLWRCVDIDDNGPLILADKIIAIMPFDAMGDNDEGSHGRGYKRNDIAGYQRRKFGSNYWGDSNIRDWLNSNEQSVTWTCGNPPDNDHVYNGLNDYADDAGFLTQFTDGERTVMKEVTQKSLLDRYEYSTTANQNYHVFNSDIADVVQNYDTAYSEYVTDKMFLLDVKQLYNVYQNDELLGGNKYYLAKPAGRVVSNSEFTDTGLKNDANWRYWLRTPSAGGMSAPVRFVDENGTVDTKSAYEGSVGVRPAFYLDTSVCVFKSGDGTSSSPYTIPEYIDIPEPTTSVMYGDVTFDGSINISDVVKLVKYIGITSSGGVLNEEEFPVNKRDLFLLAGDVTGDGSVNISDVVLLVKYIGITSSGGVLNPDEFPGGDFPAANS